MTTAFKALHSRLLALAISTALLHPIVGLAQDSSSPESASGLIEREAVRTHKYVAVTANPIASTVGSKILRRGGSAIDAAIAVQLVLGLVEPQSSGGVIKSGRKELKDLRS